MLGGGGSRTPLTARSESTYLGTLACLCFLGHDSPRGHFAQKKEMFMAHNHVKKKVRKLSKIRSEYKALVNRITKLPAKGRKKSKVINAILAGQPVTLSTPPCIKKIIRRPAKNDA